jgi:hypothetical protein
MNLVFSTRLPRIGLAALALVGAAIAAPQFAHAGAANITFAAPTITVDTAGPVTASDQTGYFDVTISDTVGSDTLAQFQASLMLNQDSSNNANVSNIQIVGGDYGNLSNSYYTQPDGIGDAAGSSPNLIDTYVMAGNSADITNSGYVYFDPTDADNSDDTNTGTVTMAANTTYSMLQVYYDIPAGTPVGSYSLTFDTNAPFNSISNPGGDPVADFLNLISNANTNSYVSPGTTIAGAINIVQTPEPTSVVLMMLGAIGLIGLGVRRARRA